MLKTLVISVLALIIVVLVVDRPNVEDSTVKEDFSDSEVNTPVPKLEEVSDPIKSVTKKVIEVLPASKEKTLDLSGQGLSKTPDYVFGTIDIEVLNLSNNNLDGALQAEVRHLQNLRILDLSNNNFTGVPAEVGQLGKLEELNLSNNSLTGLPYELGNLSNLKILNLKGNNYAKQDLDIIKQGLSSDVVILVD